MKSTSPKVTKWLIDRAVYVAVRLVVATIQILPVETSVTVAQWFSWLAVDVLKIRRRVVDENLSVAFPDVSLRERRRLARQMWEHLVLMMFEIAHVPRKIHESNWREHIQLKNRTLLAKYLLDERPTVLLSAHFGNFEVAGVTAGLLGFRTHTVARPLDNQLVSEFFQGFRESKGQYMLPKEGSAPMVAQVLERHGIIALLGDQYAGPKGCWVDFFGKPTSYHKAVAVFPLTADAPLLITYARRLDAPLQFEVGLTEVLDPEFTPRRDLGIRQVTKWYSSHLETLIRETPGQYWWLHRRWKADPPRRKSKSGKASSPEATSPEATSREAEPEGAAARDAARDAA